MGIMTKGGHRAALFLALILLTLAAGGCSLHPDAMVALPGDGRSSTLVEDVPFHAQEEYQCGPATLAMALNWSGVEVTPESLVDAVYTPSKKGSLQPAMIAAARRHGRVAYILGEQESLARTLEDGYPVVVLLNLGLSFYPVWHYAVVIGYDKVEGQYILHSGKKPYKRYSIRQMDALWGRSEYWGMLVLPPSRLPAQAEEQRWLQAVVGLERTKQWENALAGYEAAVDRWPQSHDAWMGVGNSAYALERRKRAIAAFQKAAAIRPDEGIAYNNLAHVLAEVGRYEEAEAAAEKAVASGGSYVETFRKTLDEVRRH